MAEMTSTDRSWIHGRAERFAQAWKRGPRPRIEDFLADVDKARWPSLLEELLRVECELRRLSGDEPSVREYAERFPEHKEVVAAVFDRRAAWSAAPREPARSARKPAEPPPPELANHPDYEIIRELGRGGMGVVYLARNRIMARDEVLKVLGQHIVAQPGVLDRFLREIRAVAKLRHPNIVSAYSAFRCGESFVFAMEYVVGLDLAQMVKAKGAIAVRQACYYVHQAAMGLQYAHEEGMVHRDIKPANLMLSHQKDRAVLKLLDFGLSKAASEQDASGLGITMALDSYDLGEHLTCTGDMLGTPDFIAPEQIVASQQADIRADIYSLGCTLYYLLIGHAPFPNLSLRDVLKAQRSLYARPLDQVCAEVPAALATVVAKMMAKDPPSRFQEPVEVAEALTPFFKKTSGGEASMPALLAIELDSVGLGAANHPPGSTQAASSLSNLVRPGPRGWSAIAVVLLLGLFAGWAVVSGRIKDNSPQPKNGFRHERPEPEQPGPTSTPKAPQVAAIEPSSPGPAPRAIEKERRHDREVSADERAASPGIGHVRSTPQPGPAATSPETALVAHPFRLATNGLGGREFIDPVSLRPDRLTTTDTALAWVASDAFARLATRAAIAYPRLPDSRYVLELELTVNEGGELELNSGDQPVDHFQIRFAWNEKRRMIECTLSRCIYGMSWVNADKGSHDFDAGKPVTIKLVVGDGRQTVFHEGTDILVAHSWPNDCGVGIVSNKPNSGVIHRFSLRPLTPSDAAACRWPVPPTELGLDARQSRGRLARIFRVRSALPRKDNAFAVKATATPVWAGTPMVWIKPGEFEMGSRDPNDKLRHRVRLTKGYWIAQSEVTQGEYQKVTNGNPSRITGSPFLPVDSVAWDQAGEYCRKITEIERKAGRLSPAGYEYRLPTEAEWEYACRAGGDDNFSVPEPLIWSWDRGDGRPHEVAESQPNEWGLHDMLGNAMEWCLDAWYEYPKGSKEVVVDPLKIGQSGALVPFVVRGGAWWITSDRCTSHWRDRAPNSPHAFHGFRIVLGPEIRDPKMKN